MLLFQRKKQTKLFGNFDLNNIEVNSIVNMWYQLTPSRGLCSLFLSLRHNSIHSFTVADSLNRSLHVNSFFWGGGAGWGGEGAYVSPVDARLGSSLIEEMRPREGSKLCSLVKSVFQKNVTAVTV